MCIELLQIPKNINFIWIVRLVQLVDSSMYPNVDMYVMASLFGSLHTARFGNHFLLDKFFFNECNNYRMAIWRFELSWDVNIYKMYDQGFVGLIIFYTIDRKHRMWNSRKGTTNKKEFILEYSEKIYILLTKTCIIN